MTITEKYIKFNINIIKSIYIGLQRFVAVFYFAATIPLTYTKNRYKLGFG